MDPWVKSALKYFLRLPEDEGGMGGGRRWVQTGEQASEVSSLTWSVFRTGRNGSKIKSLIASDENIFNNVLSFQSSCDGADLHLKSN